MRKSLLAALPFAAALALALPAGAQPPVLIGKVGLHNAFRISLTFPNGQLVRSIPAGTYTIVVHDYSRLHNFALGSATANVRIFTGSVPGIGTRTYTLALSPGTYVYACSAHPSVMHGTFVVTPPPSTTTTTG
ncbi:MAG: hypothetical protein JOY72_00745 [Actinobacteria bacterium]|nr:hypothetical protein [Actinomycetota bacterium]